MNAIITVLIIMLASWGVGYSLWGKPVEKWQLQIHGFGQLALGIGIIGWIALVLAEIGWFSLIALATILFVILLTSNVKRLLSQKKSAPSAKYVDKKPLFQWQPLLRFTFYAFLALLYFRPHQYVTGGSDAGVYVNLGTMIE